MLGREQNTSVGSDKITDILWNGARGHSYPPNLREFQSSAFRTVANLYAYLTTLGRTIPALVAKWMLAMAAPLRRIVARELEILNPRPKYYIYSLLDTLECGHAQSVYLFNGLLDLTNPYTDNRAVRARRHRCVPCASLLAKKKPQSVPLPAVAEVA
jgi:hypothetical protein